MTKLIHYNSSKEILEQRELEYDASGRKKSVSINSGDLVQSKNSFEAHRENGKYSFEYDELNQIVKVAGTGSYGESYVYDELGNRIKKTVSGKVRRQVEYGYDERNRLVQVKGKGEELAGYAIEDVAEIYYDGRGNMTLIKSGGKNIAEYIYDNTSRLIRTTTHTGLVAGYAYDGAGRRLRKEINNELLSVTHKGNKEKFIYRNKRIGTKKVKVLKRFVCMTKWGV